MSACKLPFDDHLALPGGVSALLAKEPSVQPFIQSFATPENLRELSANRSYPAGRRKVLTQLLAEQHRDAHEEQQQNVKQLESEQCFTVCTGHQLNVFTGPAFFIYKIAHTIKLAQQLNERYADKHIVPVYWMATEDHDFAEINHLHTKAGRMEWARKAEGAVGRMSGQGLASLAKELLDAIHSGIQHSHLDIIEKAAQSATLSDSIRTLVNGLFGQYGVVVIDADHHELKRLFLPVLEAELFTPLSSDLIAAQSARLTEAGFIAPVNPRPINLFYLHDQQRERFEVNSDGFSAGMHRFSHDALHELLQKHPERFSPNVVLRPLYQEYILPNLAYVGGAGELSYWLQLKPLFKHYETSFPALLLRNSAVVFARREAEHLNELGLTYGDLFEDEHLLMKRIVLNGEEVDPFFSESKAQLAPIYTALAEHLSAIDPTLEKRVLATWARHEKDIDGLEKSGVKARKIQREVTLNRLHKLREVLYPSGQFQERYMNFFQLSALTDGDLIEHLLQVFDGFDPSIHVISSSM